jgi:hypothetical protein
VEFATKTRRDAFARIALARTGCTANAPSAEYLLALRDELNKWVRQVDVALIDESIRSTLKDYVEQG